ncbi:hypothetical protein GCM10011360_32360 [Primorskyibacter flagellatus]|uniref:VPLPA-CTERM protein sorting domain-containing protein n=1 Tax=Primorskyibacter flagellatus TaxID=1387277 RepID=A0A917EH04_9RHOB|nr:VPLPA-CTERM sorting domain-containing protein [Primorskyibacter flagellatus]GGE42494.1 hypothetical protein GCM10011360_32360 [Primorskyibacter flagellatus]
MPRFFALLCGLLAATPASAITLGANAIVNGDAETGDLTGWTHDGIVATTSLTPTVPFGAYSFTSATGAITESMSQIIDLSGLAASIDAGNLAWEFSAQLQDRRVSTAIDDVQLSLRFLDGVGGFIGHMQFNDPENAVDQFNWNYVSGASFAPSSTRAVEVLVHFSRSAGASTDAYADEMSLVFRDISAVPLPGGLVLLGSALLGAGVVGRRQRG